MIAIFARACRTPAAVDAAKLGLLQLQSNLSSSVSSELSSSSSCVSAAYKSFSAGVKTAEPPSQAAPAAYVVAGRIQGPYTVARQPAFAVIELGPTQYKVTPDDLVYTEKLKGVDVNDKVTLNRVLLLGTQHETVIGRPFVPNASVTACIEEHFQDAKVLIFKKRRRKNSRRLNGHRQELTCIRILEINGIDEDNSDSHDAVAAAA